MEDKNYYDWLEISPKASSEVIEKAYKALVRKYHPDLQEDNKQTAEEIMKKINEAYYVLSDKEKRNKYDATLNFNTVSVEDYNKLKQELNSLKQHPNHTANNHSPSIKELALRQQLKLEKKQIELEQQRQEELAQIEYQKQIEIAKQKAYHDAYIQDMRNRGYKIKYKKTFKDYVRIVITIFVLLIVAWISWQIPFIHNWFVNLYNDNEIIKNIINNFK